MKDILSNDKTMGIIALMIISVAAMAFIPAAADKIAPAAISGIAGFVTGISSKNGQNQQ